MKKVVFLTLEDELATGAVLEPPEVLLVLLGDSAAVLAVLPVLSGLSSLTFGGELRGLVLEEVVSAEKLLLITLLI